MARHFLAVQLALLVTVSHSSAAAAAASAPPTPPPASFFPFPISFGSMGGKPFFAGTHTPQKPPPAAAPRTGKPWNRRTGVAAACSESSLSGFTSSKTLTPGLVLHWKATSGTTVNMALQATSAAVSGGWFGVGWSSAGKMYPSDCVIANSELYGAINAYTIGDYSPTSIIPFASFSLGSSPALSGGVATYVPLSSPGRWARATRYHS
ncbi:hypothetical protein CLOP_g17940 [Closterium sp. NIES-67]|nr:hypothetical protein CLOP_g17940 [Closterium sp. NIES-67]